MGATAVYVSGIYWRCALVQYNSTVQSSLTLLLLLLLGRLCLLLRPASRASATVPCAE